MTEGFLVVGIGARRGTPAAEILDLVAAALTEIGQPPAAVRAAATLDTRQDEPGIVAAARHHNWPLTGHRAALLATVPVPHPVATVAAAVTTPSVAEAACLLPPTTDPPTTDPPASSPAAVLIVPKRRGSRATVAIAWHPTAAAG